MIGQDEIADFLHASGIGAAFIQKDENCRYISGFTGSDSYLLLTPEASYLLTDSRYTEQAKEETDGFEIINCAGKLAETVTGLCTEHGVDRLGTESVLSYKQYLDFHEKAASLQFSFCDADALRRIKSEAELALIAEACRISDEGFQRMLPELRAGRTEAEMRTVLECAMLEAGSEGKSFDTIVASGLRGAYPHGTATDKVIESGELVTFDFGAIHHGYHSDITRTVAVGSLSDRQRYIFDAVFDCVALLEKTVKAGERCCDMDKKARDFLKTRELDTYFTHALGHSVGLEIHEMPVLAPRDWSILAENMTETIEPGVYIPGIGGVRIEDTVAIEKDGISVLTKFPKDFVQV